MEKRERDEEIVRRYGAGESHPEIARALGISVPLSSQVCRAAGLSRAAGERPRQNHPYLVERARKAAERVERVLELRRAGLPNIAIAEEMAIPIARVGVICRAGGFRRVVGRKSRKFGQTP